MDEAEMDETMEARYTPGANFVRYAEDQLILRKTMFLTYLLGAGFRGVQHIFWKSDVSIVWGLESLYTLLFAIFLKEIVR